MHVLDYRVVQDVGRAINPRAIASQVQGGVVQGLGYALHEEGTIDRAGRINQDSFESYKIPSASDAVPIRLEMFEGAPSIGPLGTKGAGEVLTLNVGATIACAVANATGKQVSELPLDSSARVGHHGRARRCAIVVSLSRLKDRFWPSDSPVSFVIEIAKLHLENTPR